MIKLPSFLRDILNTHGEIPAKELNPPLFITGAMRSGTTFLVDKLASHPQLLKIGAELNDVWTEIGGAQIIGKCPYLDAKHASPYYTYQMTNYFSTFIAESKSSKRHFMRMARVSETNLSRVDYDWGNIIPMNKSPHLINKLGYVHALFPGSKFILIIRDIYAHSASLKHHFARYDGSITIPEDDDGCWNIDLETKPDKTSSSYFPISASNFINIPKMWIRLNYLALKDVEKLPTDQVIVIRYEDLIKEQVNTLKRVLSFIDLSTNHKSEEAKITRLKAKKMNTTTQGDPLQKWKKQLSQDEVKSIDDLIGNQESDKYRYIMERLEKSATS